MEKKAFEQLGFRSAAENSVREREHRSRIQSKMLPFGVNFLDRVTSGIMPNDFVLIGAESGAGKTELSVRIALTNAIAGKRVHVFALEAEDGEWERRQKYQMIAQMYYEGGGSADINFLDWALGRYPFLSALEEKAELAFTKLPNLFVYYREGQFDLTKFKQIFATLNGESDIVVIDHFHYFDLNDENENKAISEIIKATRDMALLQGIPIVAVAHLKKVGKAEKELAPSMDDFHGTGNLTKIVTKIITLSPGGIDLDTGNLITYFRIPKFRFAGERTKLIGKLYFNPKKGIYEKHFAFGLMSKDKKDFQPLDKHQAPHWFGVVS